MILLMYFNQRHALRFHLWIFLQTATKDQTKNLTIEYSELYSVDQSIKRLKEIFGTITEWTNFLNIIPNLSKNKKVINKSIISSNFVASLELSKNGFIDVKQEETYCNIYIKLKN